MTDSSQKTSIIAASVLSVLAFFQLVVVFIVLVRNPVAPPRLANVPGSGENETALLKTKIDVDLAKTAPAVSRSTPGGASLASTAPAPGAESLVAPTEVDILVKRAVDIRDKGDMTGALSSLREAQNLYSDNPKIVAEFATTYEQMGLVDKALAQWKRVADAGDKAGDLYGIAAEKVRVGILPKEPLSGRDEEGLQPGSTLGFVDVVKTYESAEGQPEQVNLRMGIKARQGGAITAAEVNIQAMFYDLIDNKEVEPTDPRTTQVTSEWLTLPADWREDGLEVLKVHYAQKSAPPGDDSPALGRKYLGYIIRVYYENELQDVTADPVNLLRNFPPPVSLQKEIPE